jgi:uncharacterized protein YjbJ (UPF0337 family)
MDNTGSRSGYDSTADKAQAQTKKATGGILGDKGMEQEGEMEEAMAQGKEDEILEPWTRAQSAEEMKDKAE